MARQELARLVGHSSTGSFHGLLVESESDNEIRFTVVGHDGKKRHAAVIIPEFEANALVTKLIDHLTRER